MTTLGKPWLIGLLILSAVWGAPAESAEPAKVLYEADPAKAQTTKEVALNVTNVPDSVPMASIEEEATSDTEKIQLSIPASEQDIMTREALEKLDVMIESLEFANADLHNVIRIIGERLNINFIFDAEDISGKVTLRLHNIRLRDALDSILTSKKLAIVADRSGIFRIVPQERVGRKMVETKTEVIQLNWISAKDVVKTVKPFLSDDVGKLEANEESNALIITDVPPQIETVRNLITQIDKAERQVLIEARLADINIGAVRELGTKWSATKLNKSAITTINSRERKEGPDVITGQRDADGNLVNTVLETVTQEKFLGGQSLGKTVTTGLPGVDATDVQPLANAGGLVPVLLNGFGFSGGEGTLSFGDKIGIFGSTYDLNAVFTALEKRNIVEILANPRVTTLNNVPAKISIIEKIPYIQASGVTSSGTQVPTIEFEDAGVDIQAKPIITPNGYVRLEIKLKQMIFRERVGGGALDPPAIDERNADTNVIIQDNNTVVLGGLRQQRRLEGMDGLPWLNRIPLIGWLFKNKNYDQSKNELVLMMTPRIIEDKVSLTAREKALYNKIDNDWHLPDYFFDDVKNALDDKSERKPANKAKQPVGVKPAPDDVDTTTTKS